jgi:hypothetical protein
MRLWHFPYTPSAQQGCDPCQARCYAKKFCPYWINFCKHAVFRSFEPWLGYLFSELTRKQPAAAHYPALGALLHYVQDLAVPAHAVPIFHPEWLFGHDDFDNHAFHVDHQSLLKHRPGVCSELAQPQSLAKLLQTTREQTLASLQQPVPMQSAEQPASLKWSAFWRAQPRRAGAPEFGSYGCEGDFGDEKVRCDGHRYIVEGASYDAFADARAEAAILASAASILITEASLAPCSGATCTPTQGDERWLPSKDGLEALRGRYCTPLAELAAQ